MKKKPAIVPLPGRVNRARKTLRRAEAELAAAQRRYGARNAPERLRARVEKARARLAELTEGQP